MIPLLDLAAAATLGYIAATHREKQGRNRSRKVDPYAVAGAAMGLGKLNTTDDVLKLGGMLGAIGAFDADDGAALFCRSYPLRLAPQL